MVAAEKKVFILRNEVGNFSRKKTIFFHRKRPYLLCIDF